MYERLSKSCLSHVMDFYQDLTANLDRIPLNEKFGYLATPV
jgi:hypothetical protein